jgi:hypothetical protein
MFHITTSWGTAAGLTMAQRAAGLSVKAARLTWAMIFLPCIHLVASLPFRSIGFKGLGYKK